MEYDPQDNDLIHLLKKLKDANGAYPPEMLALRREGYLRQVAQISGAGGMAVALKNAVKQGKAAGLPPAAGTVVEALLVVALVAEAGAVTYFYRDKIAQYFQSITNSPHVQEISSPPVHSLPSLVTEIISSPSPVATLTVTVTETETGTPISTPSVEMVDGSPNGTNSVSQKQPGGSTVNPQAVSTEAPNGDNGNHYGQTPKPARTKETGTTNTNNQESSTTSQQSNNNQQSNNKKKP